MSGPPVANPPSSEARVFLFATLKELWIEQERASPGVPWRQVERRYHQAASRKRRSPVLVEKCPSLAARRARRKGTMEEL